jgi:hypothetical protein
LKKTILMVGVKKFISLPIEFYRRRSQPGYRRTRRNPLIYSNNMVALLIVPHQGKGNVDRLIGVRTDIV